MNEQERHEPAVTAYPGHVHNFRFPCAECGHLHSLSGLCEVLVRKSAEDLTPQFCPCTVKVHYGARHVT